MQPKRHLQPSSQLPKFDSFNELADEIRNMHPVELLDLAAKTIADVGSTERQVRSALFAAGYFETSLLEKSMSWLVDRRAPESLLDPDTPAWLFNVADGVIRAARRRTEEDRTSYLIEMKLPGGPVGSMQIRIDNNSGAITNYFAAREPLPALVKLLRAMEGAGRGSKRNGSKDNGTYHKVGTQVALEALLEARRVFDLDPGRSTPANPWPHNRALLDFVLDEFEAV